MSPAALVDAEDADRTVPRPFLPSPAHQIRWEQRHRDRASGLLDAGDRGRGGRQSPGAGDPATGSSLRPDRMMATTARPATTKGTAKSRNIPVTVHPASTRKPTRIGATIAPTLPAAAANPTAVVRIRVGYSDGATA